MEKRNWRVIALDLPRRTSFIFPNTIYLYPVEANSQLAKDISCSKQIENMKGLTLTENPHTLNRYNVSVQVFANGEEIDTCDRFVFLQ